MAISSPAAGAASPRLRAGEVRLIPVESLSELIRMHANGAVVPVHRVPLRATLMGGSSEMYGRFGWHLAFDNVVGDSCAHLLVGAPLINREMFHPSYREVGGVFVWDGGSLPVGVVKNLKASASWTAVGSRPRGRMGSSFSVVQEKRGPGVGIVAIGSPRADGNSMEMAGLVDHFAIPFSKHGIFI